MLLPDWWTLFILYVGFIFQSYLTSQFLTIFVESSMGRQKYKEELRTVNEYMRVKSLPPDMRDRVRDFYAVRYKSKKVGETRVMSTRAGSAVVHAVM